MEDQQSTCSGCCKRTNKGSDFGTNKRHHYKHNQQISDVSSVSEIQEMAFTIGGLNQHQF